MYIFGFGKLIWLDLWNDLSLFSVPHTQRTTSSAMILGLTTRNSYYDFYDIPKSMKMKSQWKLQIYKNYICLYRIVSGPLQY